MPCFYDNSLISLSQQYYRLDPFITEAVKQFISKHNKEFSDGKKGAFSVRYICFYCDISVLDAVLFLASAQFLQHADCAQNSRLEDKRAGSIDHVFRHCGSIIRGMMRSCTLLVPP